MTVKDHPRSLDSASQRRSNQGWSLAVVKAARAGCLCEANIILLGVLLVSGTSFSAHLLLLCLFFTLTTPRPLLLILSLYFLFVRRRSASTPCSKLFLFSSFLLMGIEPLHKTACSNDTQTSGFQTAQRSDLLLHQELFAGERPFCQQVLVTPLARTFRFNSGQSCIKNNITPHSREAPSATLCLENTPK